MKSWDESKLVGAWLVFHMLVDSKHAILRGAVKHWFRKVREADLIKREETVLVLEAERASVLASTTQLSLDQSKFLSEKAAMSDAITAARGRADTADQLRVLSVSVAETTIKTQYQDNQELVDKLHALEEQNEKLSIRNSRLTRSAKFVNSKLAALCSIKTPSSADISFFLSTAPPSSPPKFSRHNSPPSQLKHRTFTAEHDLWAERRRRSHLASPSIHALPCSDFFDESVTPTDTSNGPTSKTVPPHLTLAEVEPTATPAHPATPAATHSAPKATFAPSIPTSTPRARVNSKVIRPSASSLSATPHRIRPLDPAGEELWNLVCSPQPATSTGNTVQVAVRVRPFNKREKDMGAGYCVDMSGKSIALVEPTSKEKTTFTFDYIFNTTDPTSSEFADQEDVFKTLGIDILRNAWEGYNACLFAYGQTGAGKSWSITGSHEKPGIIPLFCDKLFYFIDYHRPENTSIAVECSFLEIYNERVQDLLNPDGTNLKVREHPITGVFVEGLSFAVADSYEDVEVLMEEGTAARTIGATNMNASSSRSHSIFEIVITQTVTDPISKDETEKQARVVLIDLAGSERASSTGATGARLKEGAQINKSLSSLGACIRGLSECLSKKGAKLDLQKIPFRNSVLTMLLKNSLAGNSKTTMLAAVSPADVNYIESLSTLRYAQSAKKIATQAVVNEDPTAKIIRELREEVNRLKKEGGGEGGGTQQGAIREVEAIMLEKTMSKGAKLQQSERLQARRSTVLAMTGRGNVAEDFKKFPHLSNLNQDPMLSGTLKLIIADDADMKVGRKDAEQPQDVQLAGLGIKKEHCVISYRGAGKLTIKRADDKADVYVNGRKISGHDANFKLTNGDILVLGVCTHIYQVCVPKGSKQESVIEEGDEEEDEEVVALATDEDDTTVSYNEAVRQVMLGRPENAQQKKVRLAHLVLSTWRRPVFRRLFEERLVDALRMSAEANEIAHQMNAGVKFTLHLGCAVHLDDAASLSLREVIKYEHVHVLIRASSVDLSENFNTNGVIEVDSEEEEEEGVDDSSRTMCECGRTPFAEFLETLRNDYNAMKPFCATGDETELERLSEKEPHPPVFSELLTAKGVEVGALEITVGELFAHMKNVQSSCDALEIDRELLIEHCQQVSGSGAELGDDTVLSGDEVLDVMQSILEKTFDDCIHPLVEQFGVGKYGGAGSGGGGVNMEDLESLMLAFRNGEREALIREVVEEMEKLRTELGTEVDLGEEVELEAVAEDEGREGGESPMPKKQLGFEGGEGDVSKIFNTSTGGDEGSEGIRGHKASLDIDILGADGADWEGGPVTPKGRVEEEGMEEVVVAEEEVEEVADRWDEYQDEEGNTYFFNEASGETKWAKAGEEEEELAEEEVEMEVEVAEVEEEEEPRVDERPSSPRRMSTPTKLVDEPVTDPQELDKYARLYSMDDHDFDEYPEADFRDHAYDDGEEKEEGEDSWKGEEEEEEALSEVEVGLESAESASEAESLDDWKIVHDEDSGKDYWWSDSREEAQWVDDLEEGHDPHADHDEKYHHLEIGEDGKERHWEVHEDEEGNSYLYDPESGESKWITEEEEAGDDN